MIRQRALTIAMTLLPVALVGLASCSKSDGTASAASAATAPGTEPAVAKTPSRSPSTTVAPTSTEASTTTAAPTTTEAPTTTVAPTTVPPPTVATTTTLTPLPPGAAVAPEPVAPTEGFVAVGGRNGGDTAAVQSRLLELGFWVTAADGQYGLTTSQAVMAFQKYVGLGASGRVDQATADALATATERARGTVDSGTMVEVDKARQLLFIVRDGRTEWVLNASTGNGKAYEELDQNTPDAPPIKGVSITPDGLHRVYRERPEGWWEGDLGKIYRPKYVVGGVAIHGSSSIPNYPASHGCIRVSVPAMDMIWDSGIIPKGTRVWIHGDEPE